MAGALNDEPEVIKANVQKMHTMHEHWNFIIDDDKSCVQKLRQLSFVTPKTIQWYETTNKLGKYRSDVCRLAQLWLHGGVYLDNDFEMLLPLDTVLTGQHTMVTARAMGGTTVFQAILAAPASSPLVQKAMMYSQEFIAGTRQITGWLGPVIMGQVLQEEYQTLAPEVLYPKGVLMLSEQTVARTDQHMKGRSSQHHCDVGVFTPEHQLVAFSRVHGYDQLMSCYDQSVILPPCTAYCFTCAGIPCMPPQCQQCSQIGTNGVCASKTEEEGCYVTKFDDHPRTCDCKLELANWA